jgi:hypothetical protein
MSTTEEATYPVTDVDTDEAPDTNEALGTGPADERKPGRYVVLEEDSDGKWEMVKTVEAFGPQAAKRAVIEADPSYLEAIEKGEAVTLVAVAERYWKPSTPRVKTTTSVDFD